MLDETLNPYNYSFFLILTTHDENPKRLVALLPTDVWIVVAKHSTRGWEDQHVVDVRNTNCSCRKWELIGISCKHAIATLNEMAKKSEHVTNIYRWLNKVYELDTWKEAYSYKVKPIKGRIMWRKSLCPIKLIPPPHHTQVARHKKKRKNSEYERKSQSQRDSGSRATNQDEGIRVGKYGVKKLTRKYVKLTMQDHARIEVVAESVRQGSGEDKGRQSFVDELVLKHFFVVFKVFPAYEEDRARNLLVVLEVINKQTNYPFVVFHEPFVGLKEIDYDLYGIYMDHEPEDEFINTLNKCKDRFLNVLLTGANLPQVYHGNYCASEEEAWERVERMYNVHDPNTLWYKMKPKLGDIFESPEQLKFCVANYVVAKGYEIYFSKSDSVRVVAKCGSRNKESTCLFRLHAGWMYKERSFQIKTMSEKHNCARSFKFGSTIRRHYLSQIANQPNFKRRDMVTNIKQQFKVVLSIGQCRSTKKWAKEMIEEKLTEHYATICDYSNQLLRSNRGSTCKVGVINNPDGKNYFYRFYICFESLGSGHKIRCRKFIGLDCFSERERDANNQVYLIAWVVVDVESKRSWTWFFDLIHGDLSLDSGRGLGLLEAVKDSLPNVEHRQCARHIYANFKKAYTGLDYKKLFWASAMSCKEGDFKRSMAELKKLSHGAYDYVMSKQPRSWCRENFDAVENGISECFNSIIIDAWKKTLITMSEDIRIYVMDRIQNMTKKSIKWKTNVCHHC
ncbi:hypothetical protein LXL04_024338 [Taraxacum kok-saghyz]